MSEPKAATAQPDLDALRALRADASRLERLEGLLDRFNVFEAIGYIHDEMMHSRFLAFLLDPRQNHGLGNTSLKSFLRKGMDRAGWTFLSRALDAADDRDLNQTTAHTEVHTDDGRIDILLLNNVGEWAVIVENKVLSDEHDEQLARYHRFASKAYQGWDTFGIYLTRFGDRLSHEAYDPLGYAAVCDLLDDVLRDGARAPNADARMAIGHYTDMVRRHLVGRSGAIELAQEIYRKHSKALDFIQEHRPDPQRTA